MKKLATIALIVAPATLAFGALTFGTLAFGQSSNRYGGAGSGAPLPENLAEIESAFSSPQPTGTPVRPGGNRYGGGSGRTGVPALPPSTPITSRGEATPSFSPPPAQQPNRSRPTPVQPQPAGSATTARVQPQLGPPRTVPQRRSLPRNQQQPSTGVILPEGPRQPAASTTRTAPTTSSVPVVVSKAQRLITWMLQPRPGSQLTGTPISVTEVARGAATRDEQSRRVEAYWDLCASVADYYMGLLEEDELKRLQNKVPAVSQALRAAEQDLHNRVETSLRAAHASQRRLASLMGTPGATLVPADGPFCGEYRTEFERIFAGRSLGSAQFNEAKLLHELLASRYTELLKVADAVERSQDFVQQVAKNSRTSNSDGTAMLRALELLALNRRAFVQIAKDYNRRITRYTELATPGRVDTNMLVAMLVGSSERVAINSVASLR